MVYRAPLACTLAFLAGSLWSAGGEAVIEDEELGAARDLFEQFILAEHAEPHDQLEALEAVAGWVDSAADARGLLPLYRLVLRSPRVADEAVALAAAEGFALCLVRSGEPFAAVAREAEARGGTPVGTALTRVAERFGELCGRKAAVGRASAAGLGPRDAAQSDVRALAPRLGRAARADAGVSTLRVGDPREAARPAGLEAKTPGVELGHSARAAGVGPVAGAPEAARSKAASVGLALAESFATAPWGGAVWAGGGVASSRREAPLGAGGEVAHAKAPGLSTAEPRGAGAAAPAPGAIGEAATARQGGVAAAGRDDGSALRETIHKAAAEALGALVKELSDEADWMVRHDDHETALDILGQVVREAAGTEFSQQALTRAFALVLAHRKAQTRDELFTWFETWVADRGGKAERAAARLLVLQQRYRDGSFEAARDGLRAFVADHGDTGLGPQAKLLLALATWRAGDRDEAVGQLDALVRSDPGHESAPRAQFLVGYLHFAAGEQERAFAAFLRVITHYPESAFAEKAVEFLGAQAAWRRAGTLRLAPQAPQEGPQEQAPAATVRLLWDDGALYVGFECRDADVRSEAGGRETGVLLGDAVRLLLVPPAPQGGAAEDDEPRAYFDLAVGPQGALADSKVAFGRGVLLWESIRAAAGWTCLGARCAAVVDGTVNDERPDRGWSAELAIPFDALGVRPAAGQAWRANAVWGARQAGGDRETAAWAPLGAWLPQPGIFGTLTLTDEPK